MLMFSLISMLKLVVSFDIDTEFEVSVANGINVDVGIDTEVVFLC